MRSAWLFPNAGRKTQDELENWIVNLLSEDEGKRQAALADETFAEQIKLLIEAAQLEISSSTEITSPNATIAMRLPGTRCSLIFRENIQAAKIAKVGFRNSEGCMENGPTETQRVAPLISVP